MSRAAASLLCLVLCGCSSVAHISSAANDIRSEARVLHAHGTAANDPVVVEGSQRIYDLAAEIHDTLPGVKDRVPEWVNVLLWGAVAVVVAGIAVILWQTGLGTAVRVAIGWIPRNTRQDAELAAAMMDPEKTEDAREYIAARRASNPLFDSAFRKARAAQEKKP